MRNKFIVLSTLVPMTFAISFLEATPESNSRFRYVPKTTASEQERDQAFTKLGSLIESTYQAGQQTSTSCTQALEQFKNLQSMFKDVVSARNAAQADLKAQKDALAKEQDEHNATRNALASNQKQLENAISKHAEAT